MSAYPPGIKHGDYPLPAGWDPADIGRYIHLQYVEIQKRDKTISELHAANSVNDKRHADHVKAILARPITFRMWWNGLFKKQQAQGDNHDH